MKQVLSAAIALSMMSGAAIAADMLQSRGAPFVAPPPIAVAPQVTVVEELGSPPLPYKGFEYPLDDASYFYPPHPAAVPPAVPYAYGGRRVVSGPVAMPMLPFAHVQWCQVRYASYRASDNSFLPPRGQRRICVSPYQ